jgi:NAD(P)-dependent dehydrogenase (short-subunit alcohol dehydrogenase family)
VSLLEGRVAVVTGAARDRSIGGGIARVLARHGADVVVNDLAVTDEGHRRVREIEELGRRAALIPADVTVPTAVEALMTQTVERMGRLDIVVANAGLCDWENVADLSAGLWERLVGVNLHGCFATCRAAAAVMRAQGEGGRIIVTSSVHAQMPFVQMGVYGGTKQAVGHLVGVMAREWAPDGITVNHIGPGCATPEAQAGVKRIIPLGHRAGEPEEMGEAVAYLASDGARYTTGAYIRVDGGFVMTPY